MPATVVSLYPQALNEPKPGLIPANYHIDASNGKDPEILVVGWDAENNRELEVTRGIHVPLEEDPKKADFRVVVPAREVAGSIVKDFINASILINEDAYPALFWLEGNKNVGDIILSHGEDLEKARIHQNLWFEVLLNDADDIWQRFRQHRSISDLHRMAAKHLGVEREWLKKVSSATNIPCKFCTVLVSSSAVVCPNCKNVLNSKRFEEMTA